MEEQKETLHEKLMAYSDSDYYPFHMPGHKRNKEQFEEGESKPPYLYDITEIDGFDNLHHPQEIIRERQEQVSVFYGSEKSYFLVNGSTCGILAAISAASERKSKIILARNSHKAAYNALFINNMEAEYIYPDYMEEYGIYGGMSANEVERALKQSEVDKIGAVFITSPTYEGVVSDVKAIADVVHRYGIPLIVDEAHGAHFGMYGYFPMTALHCGADIVIQSLHKTLPSLTQTAILHVSKSSMIDTASIERYLAIYQSSSPSYVLMDSMDRCMSLLMNQRKELFELYAGRLQIIRKKFQNFKFFKLFYQKENYSIYDYDKSKIVILVDKRYYSGKKLYDRLLEKYHLQMEMAAENYVIAMTSVYDTEEGFLRLMNALEETERELRIGIKYREIYADGTAVGSVETYPENTHSAQAYKINLSEKAVVCRKIKDATLENYDMINLSAAKGRISQEFIYAYPPGVPILAPGEIISENVIRLVERYLAAGLNVQGMQDESCKRIKVVRENWTPIHFG